MGIFGLHRHLKLQLLSQYLDGRLSATGEARVGREVASCATCQDELESLQATVSLLARLPEIPLPHSFTLATAPTFNTSAQRIDRPSPMVFRTPNWVYAGAASLAGLALALLVSADATGLLTSNAILDARATAEAPAAVFESQVAAPPASTQDSLAPEVSEQPMAAAPQAEELPAQRAAPKDQDSAPVERSQAPPSLELAQTAESGQVESAEQSPAVEPSQLPEAPTQGIAGAGASGPAASNLTPTPRPAVEAKVEPEAHFSQPAPVSRIPVTREEKTALAWRLLEGVAAGLCLLFLIGLTLKWRRSRRTAYS